MRSRPTLMNCVIAGNIAESQGGGIGGVNSSPTLTHCTVAGNAAWDSGGGIFASRDVSNCVNLGFDCNEIPTVTLRNSIVWSNGCRSVVVNQSAVANRHAALDATFSCVEGEELAAGPGNISEDPLFCGWTSPEVFVDSAAEDDGDGSRERPYRELSQALRDYSYALSRNSPCLSSGAAGVDMGAENGNCGESRSQRLRVHLAAGEYDAENLTLAHDVSLHGAGAQESAIRGTVVGLRTGASLSDVTVTGGRGGGIRICDAQRPQISRCTITQNQSAGLSGGGVSCDSSSPRFVDCVIESNVSGTQALPESGGGVFCENGASPEFRRCTISRNHGTFSGGGLDCLSGSSPLLVECSVTENTSPLGGGIHSLGASPTLTRCVVAGNTAVRTDRDLPGLGTAGGVSLLESPATLTNCLIVGNREHGRESDSAGGVSSRSSPVTLVYCTVPQNSSSNGLGALSVTTASDASVDGAILWANEGRETIGTTDSDLSVANSCIEAPSPLPGPGNLNDSPRFIELGHWDDGATPDDFSDDTFILGDYDLEAGSPCLDGGDPATAPDIDLPGGARPCGDGVDLGAFESDCDERPPPRFLRGDCNGDGAVQGVTDAVFLLLFQFGGGKPPLCLAACDNNGDRSTDGVTDAVFLLSFSFLGGEAPVAPFPKCGPWRPIDLTLGCANVPAGCE